ncbi:MAG TPA: UbiA family prenyltransferase [Thermomicrobiales bacterium]|nr:UbiA family prenyltransferase [Thermomicrobiales bacterium]
MIGTVWAYIRLTHPWAVAVVMIATATFGLLAVDGEPEVGRFVLLLAGMLGGQVAIGASNEWHDREADALDKPHRPIPSGAVSPTGALAATAAGLVMMTAAGAALGIRGLILLAIGTGAGLTYNLWLKRTPLSWLPYLIALPLLPTWVWLVMDEFNGALLWLYPLGATFVLAIHLAQTLPDIGADSRRGEQGIGVVLGRRWSEIAIWVAAFGSTLGVGVGGWVTGDDWKPAVVAAGIVTLILALALLFMRVERHRLQPHLFKVLTSCAVILATGWILSAT